MAPGGKGRGGKFQKPQRGGGKKFSKNLRPLDSEGNEIGMWGDPRDPKAEAGEEEEEDEEEDEEDEEESSDEDGANKPELTREQRRAAAKAKKEAAIARKQGKAPAQGTLPPESSEEEDEEEDGLPVANPNHTASARKQASSAPLPPPDATKPGGGKPVAGGKPAAGAQLSRREREALQAQSAKENYQKLHAAGKTDEARADLARLALVREKRDADAARKKAEKDEKDESEKARQKDLEAKEAAKREAALGPATKGKGKGKVAGKA